VARWVAGAVDGGAARVGEAGAVEAGTVEAGTVEAGPVETDVVGLGVVWSPGAVAGLNVATDSIAPATRHTARMLASSGMMVPCAVNGPRGPASRRSRFRRRCARCSRW